MATTRRWVRSGIICTSGASWVGDVLVAGNPLRDEWPQLGLHATINPDALHAFRRAYREEVPKFLQEVARLPYQAGT